MAAVPSGINATTAAAISVLRTFIPVSSVFHGRFAQEAASHVPRRNGAARAVHGENHAAWVARGRQSTNCAPPSGDNSSQPNYKQALGGRRTRTCVIDRQG